MNDETIAEFGEQWSRFGDTTDGYFGSEQALADICGPLLSVGELVGRRVVEIGSGNGRIVNMLISAGAAHVTAVEPSAGIEVLKENTKRYADRIDYLQVTGEDLPAVDAEIAFSIGVLHHIEDPSPTVRRIHEVLPPGGRFVLWVYGREGNGSYIALAEGLRFVTRRIPDFLLAALAHLLNALLGGYVVLCRFVPLPLRTYMREVMSKYDRRRRYFLIFDQLNCGYARYYNEHDARRLMEGAGFERVELYHRHGMSWTVLGYKAGRTSMAAAC